VPALAVVIVAAGSFYWYLEAETTGTRCSSAQPAGTTGYRQKWNWWPFAYACIYADPRGGEVERFPKRPHIGDLR
jgi:hypothetical protein